MDQHTVRTYTVNKLAEAGQLGEVVQKNASILSQSALREDGWTLDRPEVLKLMAKLREKGAPLEKYVNARFYRGILTGFNEAFVIDEATRKRLIDEDPKSAEIIKPWLRGRDIKKWRAEWGGLYIIAIASSANKKWPWPGSAKTDPERIFSKTYPAIYAHLSRHKDALVKRDDQGEFWWELRSCAYYAEFGRPKIVMCRFMKSPLFCFESGGIYVNDANYFLNVGDKYVLAFLLSSVGWELLTKLGTDLSGGFYQLFINMMEKIPIFPATDKQKAPIIERVETILKNPAGPDVPRLESEIDQLVFDLYGLTEEERQMLLASKQTSR